MALGAASRGVFSRKLRYMEESEIIQGGDLQGSFRASLRVFLRVSLRVLKSILKGYKSYS